MLESKLAEYRKAYPGFPVAEEEEAADQVSEAGIDSDESVVYVVTTLMSDISYITEPIDEDKVVFVPN
jgi:hypothetical protein